MLHWTDDCSIWLTDLAATLPDTVRLDGLDLSLDATPPALSLPPNVTLQQWDIKSPVPAALVGQYDVVHARNFAFVLQDQEIPGVLRNLVELLSTLAISRCNPLFQQGAAD